MVSGGRRGRRHGSVATRLLESAALAVEEGVAAGAVDVGVDVDVHTLGNQDVDPAGLARQLDRAAVELSRSATSVRSSSSSPVPSE